GSGRNIVIAESIRWRETLCGQRIKPALILFRVDECGDVELMVSKSFAPFEQIVQLPALYILILTNSTSTEPGPLFMFRRLMVVMPHGFKSRREIHLITDTQRQFYICVQRTDNCGELS